MITALKFSNDERDMMITALMEDLQAGKKTIIDLEAHIGWLDAKKN